jgi:hypothetical protein
VVPLGIDDDPFGVFLGVTKATLLTTAADTEDAYKPQTTVTSDRKKNLGNFIDEYLPEQLD